MWILCSELFRSLVVANVLAEEGNIFGHAFHAEVLKNSLMPCLGEGPQGDRIVQQLFDAVGQALRGGIANHSSASGLHQFGKSGVARLHDRNACRHGFDDVQAKGLSVERRRGEQG